MFLSFNAATDRAGLRSAREAVRSERAALLGEIATETFRMARTYFDIKSRGGRGYTGRVWRALAESTAKEKERLARKGRLIGDPKTIGVRSGRIRASLYTAVHSEDKQSTVEVGYGDPAAEFLNRRRILIPPRLPNEWRRRQQAIIDRWVLAKVQSHLPA